MTHAARGLGLALAVLILTTVAASSARAEALVGKYDCRGMNAGANVYRGEVTITQKGRGYRIDWRIGPQEYNGIGFVDGDRLVVSWIIVAQGALSHGVVNYKINKNGTLEGKWLDASATGVYTEVLTPKTQD
jgi:hypothetical protein